MMDYDNEFSKYLDSNEADEIFKDQFSALRRAFIAGFLSANGLAYSENRVLNFKGSK